MPIYMGGGWLNPTIIFLARDPIETHKKYDALKCHT